MESTALTVVVAFIQPFQLESTIDVLRTLPMCPGLSVATVRGVGCTGAHPPRAGERTEVDALEERLRLEIYCASIDADAIVDVLARAARTGHPGDGKIFVLPVLQGRRIRNDDTGVNAVRP